MTLYTGHLVKLWRPSSDPGHSPVAFGIVTDTTPVYGKPVSVQFVIDNTGDYDLYYTTDGSEPSHSSAKYAGPFILYVSCVVSVRAIEKKSGWMTSVRTAQYTISVSVSLDTEACVYYDPFLLTMTTTDPAYDIFYSTHGDSPAKGIKYTGPVLVTGTWIVKAVAMYHGVVCGLVCGDVLFERYAHALKRVKIAFGPIDTFPMDVLSGCSWGGMMPADVLKLLLWAKTHAIDVQTGFDWSRVCVADEEILSAFSRVFTHDSHIVSPWDRVTQTDQVMDASWDKTLTHDTDASVLWNLTGKADQADRIVWGLLDYLDLAVRLEWGKLDPVDQLYPIPWTKMKPMDKKSFSAFVPGNDIHREKILLALSRIPWISAARFIMTEQNVTFKRVADDEPVHILTGSFGIDTGSWLWTFNGVIPSRNDLDKIKPGVNGEVEVELGINGYTARFIINGYTANNAWGTGTYSITGRSSSCVLGEPYCPKETKMFNNTTAQQIVANELTGTGWAYVWNLITNPWNINGEMSVNGKTKIDIIADIAKAVGGIVQTDLFEKKIILKRNHPVSPESYSTVTPDETILQGILDMSEEYVSQPKYNAIVVSGKTTGVNAMIRRKNTPGDRPAPEIVDPLLTAQALNIERGRSELDEAGYDYLNYTITLPLPNPASLQKPKLLLPGYIVEVMYKSETWRGRVVSVEVGWQKAKTRQRVIIRRPIL